MMMRSLATASFLASLALVTPGSVNSFAPTSTRPWTTSSSSSTTTTSLGLLPEQGKQLEAAMNAAYASSSSEDEDLSLSSSSDGTTATTAERPPLSASARAFVSRVFSLPSSIIRGHPHPNLEGLLPSAAAAELESYKFEWNDKQGDDVVLFPLVGFRLVQDAPDHYSVLPTHKSANPSCRLRTNGVGRDPPEELVGWFSRACYLDLYNEERYCEPPPPAASSSSSND